jgi:cysteine desulfurase/selenocysteine lyase
MRSYRKDFPLLQNRDIVYFDNAATTQKPRAVLDAVNDYYTEYCANTHRSSHGLGNRATQEFENARASVARFLGAAHSEQIVFTKGTTEGINLVASSFVRDRFKKVIITSLEHHANIIPWHLLGFVKGRGLEVVPMRDDLNTDLDAYEAVLRENPGNFVAITHISNVFGIINPVKEMVATAHRYGCFVLVDGAQAVAHLPLDMQAIDADFYVFSGHKMHGPTGIGALYGRKELLEAMPPYHGGGAMIKEVTFEASSYLDPPLRFEAGTQPIAQAIGLGRAVEYLGGIGLERIREHDTQLMRYAKEKLSAIEGVRFYTDAGNVAGSLSINVEGLHHGDLGTLLDKQGIILRTGHHCAQPTMLELGIEGTVRFSFALYNTEAEVDRATAALEKATGMLR